MKVILPFLLLLLLLVSCTQKKAEVWRPATSDLGIGEATPVATLKLHVADSFRLDLDSAVFVYGFADQKSVDVEVLIYGPDDAFITSVDGPANGPEFFKFTSPSSGVHKIVVAPFEENTGEYSLTISGAEPQATDPQGVADQFMKAALGSDPIGPGAAVAVQKDGKILFSKGYGYADLESDRKITPATIFHIASVSKQFTTFAIAMLADQGKLSLDDDIRKYLPEIHDFGTVITINHLAHHTSGLRDQWNLLMMAGWRLDDVITQKQIMRVISRQRELNFKPGDEYVYCNTGFTLMAEIVSRVAGESFADWTKKNMFDPLEMTNTLFYDDHEKVVKNRAYSYYKGRAGEGYSKSVLNYANAGATSLFTTVEDLSKWAVNFEMIKVGNANVMAMMNRKFILNGGDTIRYLLGQVVDKYKGLTTYSHGGGDAGYRTFLLRFPDQHLSISVFSNLASFDPGGLSFALADACLVGQFKQEKPGPQAPPPPEQPKEPFDPKAVKLADYTGRFYSVELETRYTFEVVNDTLVAHHQRHNDLKVIPTKADGFSTNFLGDVVFTRDKKGNIEGFKASNGRVRNLDFRKE